MHKPISANVLAMVGCLCLVVLSAVLVRYAPQMLHHVKISQHVASIRTATSTQAQTSVNDMAVALSGDLVQSIPPNWTFIQQGDSHGDLSVLPGLAFKQEIQIKPLQGDHILRLTEYTISNLVAFEKEKKTRMHEEKIDTRNVKIILAAKGKNISGVLLEGTTRVVVISAEGVTTWSSVEGLPPAVRDLAQSIRVQ